MRLRLRLGLVACLLAVGCATRARTPPLRAAPRPAAQVPVARVPVPRPSALDAIAPLASGELRRAALLESGELIVGGPRGLEALRPDGSARRTISAGPALHPRRFGREHVIALQPSAANSLSDGASVLLIALADGTRSELAKLPPFHCREATQARGLDVQDVDDFAIDPAKGVACLGLMDGGWTMARLRVRTRIDLRTQKLLRWLVVGEATCTAPADVQVGDPVPDGSCWGTPPVENARPDRAGFPFTFEEEQIRMPAAPRGGVKRRVPGYQRELVSPSARWLVLSGDFSQRDNAYRRLLLLDRRDGKLYPIAARSGGWPAPLTAAGTKYTVPIRQAEPFPGETDLRWVGAAESGELLVVGRLIVRPGVASFDLGDGELAR